MVRLEVCLLAEAVHAFLKLLYDIAVEVRGVQDEQGCRLDQVRVGRWILGSMNVAACLSRTTGCVAYGQSVNVVPKAPQSQQGSNGYRIAASVCCRSKNALGTEKAPQVAKRQGHWPGRTDQKPASNEVTRRDTPWFRAAACRSGLCAQGRRVCAPAPPAA